MATASNVVHKLISSFATGEVSPPIYSRVDLEKYSAGLKYCRNAFPLAYGSVTNRPGTIYCAETKDSSKVSVLIDFQYGDSQSYILEFGDYYMRPFKDGGQVVMTTADTGAWITGAAYIAGDFADNGGLVYRCTSAHTSGATTEPGVGASWSTKWVQNAVYEIVTPFSAAEVSSLVYTQSANVLYLYHPNRAPQEVARTDHNAWSIADHDLQCGPQLDENITQVTLTLSGSVQALAPASVIGAGSWTASWGTLNDATDDYPASTGDYISSSAPAYCELKFSPALTPPTRSGHVLKVVAGVTASDMTISLYQGSTSIYSARLRTTTTTTVHSLYIPKYAANAITDYTDLRVRLAATSTGVFVYSIELQVPMPTTGGTASSRDDVDLFKGNSVAVAASAATFLSTHIGSVWAVRYTSSARSFTYVTPKAGTFQSTAFPADGDWTLTFDPDDSTLVDSAPMYMEKSIDGGRSWYKRLTLPDSESKEQSDYSGSEITPCLFRFIREKTPGTDDCATITLSMQGKEEYAYFKITAVASNVSATAVLQTDFSKPGTEYETWSEAAWSDERGWPRVCTFYQDRLMSAGTEYQPQTVWGSRTGDYTSHKRNIPVKDDDGITANVISRQVNAVRALAPMSDLVIGTSGAVWKLSPAGENDVLAPGSIKVRFQTQYGSADLPLLIVGSSCLMVQSMATKVRDLAYSISSDAYDGSNLSILASHLLQGYTIIDWCYQAEPYGILWAVRSDGKLLALTYDRSQNVWAWSLHELTGGVVESIKSIHGTTEDEVWMIVRRTINSVTKRYIEYFSSRQVVVLADAKIMDSCITYSGAATTTITGLNHLEGKAVAVLADGIPVAGKTVADGQIVLATATTKAQIGIGYVSTIETLDLELNLRDGSALDRQMAITQAMLRVQDSCDFQVGVDINNLSDTCLPSSLYTGETVVYLPTDYETQGRLVLYQDKPLPFTVNAIVARVSIGG